MNYYLKLFKFGLLIGGMNLFGFRKLFKLTLAVTNKCNSKCQTCNIWKVKAKREMSLTNIKLFFEKNRGFRWIDLTGGEVFLRTDVLEIIKIIKYTQKDLFLLHIPTNSMLENKIYGEVLHIIKLGLPKFLLTISLDANKVKNDQLRGVEGHYKKAISLYKKLKKYKSKNFDCFFGVTVSNLNYLDLGTMFDEIKKEIPDIKKTDIHYNLVHNSSLYYKNSRQKLVDKKLKASFEKIYNLNKWRISPIGILESIYQKKVTDFLRNKKFPLKNKCMAGRISVFINESSEVYPCSMWDKKIANLNEIDFDLAKIRYLFDNKKCSQCWTPCEAYQNIMVNLI